jgi:ABC-type bacteriocin/lantibiotic exporter with double-glycine peptidase domain
MISKLYYILDKKNKNKINFFLFLNLIYFLLEFFSLASLPLFFSFIINPNYISEKFNFYFKYLFSKEVNFDLLLVLSSFIIIAFFLKNLFFILITYFQNNFLKKIKLDLSKKFFSFYIKSPYLYHLESNPSTLSRNISDEIPGLYLYFFHLSSLFREILVILIIFIFLIFINFNITLTVLTFLLVTSFLYIKFIKPYLNSKALINQKLRKITTQIIFETFGSIKDLKVLNKENEIINLFTEKVNIFEKNLLYFSYFEKLPRIFLEFFSILLISLICFFYLKLDQNFNILIPTLSLLAVAFMRFAPAFGSIIQSIYYMKLFQPTINLIFSELKNIETNQIYNLKDLSEYSNNENIVSPKNCLVLDKITFSYPGNKFKIINNISMSILKGSIVGITGKTGAGKSTLFHLMLGLLKPQQGNIFFNGKNIFSDLDAWRDEIGYISQNIYLLDESIKKNITFNFIDNNCDIMKLRHAIKIAGLEDKVNSLEKGVDSKVGIEGLKFSGGERQRIAIARAVYRNPNILFMDESTSALDDTTEELIMNNLLNDFNGKTIIIIAHRKSTINRCKEVWNLQDGRVLKQI